MLLPVGMRFNLIAIEETLVRFRGSVGIADSDWLKLAHGVGVVTGRNNVGKSRLLKTIGDLPAASQNPVPFPNVPQLQVVTDSYRLETDIRPVKRGDYFLSPSTYTVFTPDGGPHYEARWVSTPEAGGESLEFGPPQGTKSRRVAGSSINAFRGAAILEGHPVALAAIDRLVYIPPERPVRAAQNTTPVVKPKPDGSDLPQVLFYHISNATPCEKELQRIICEMFPEVEQILASATEANTITVRLRDKFAHSDVSLDDAGTGLARMLHLIACVLIYEAGRVFLIDEPTTHLHPGSEKVLAEFLRGHTEHDYVISTHSPIFINAIDPDRAWLITRDERGTVIQPAFTEDTGRKLVFQELGVWPGDIAIAERLLFVEGLTDELVYPIILDKLGWNVVATNCEVIELHGSEVARPLQRAIDHLASVISVKYLVMLDGDKTGSFQGDAVKYLPVPEVEDLFLRDPQAIYEGFERVFAAGWGTDRMQGWLAEWTKDRVAAYLAADHGNAKGKRVLRNLAQEMGTTYSPAVHGPAIADVMNPAVVEDLRECLRSLFE